MKFSVNLFALCLCLSSIGKAHTARRPHSDVYIPELQNKKLMGYYPSYNHNSQSPKQLNYALYTDVLFFVAVPNPDYSFSYGELKTEVAENLARAFVHEANKHGTNTILSFGGWTGSRHFSDLTSSHGRRKAFAKALVRYSKKLGFGGIDIDWEYPNAEGIGCNTRSPLDTVNFGLLLKEIKRLWPKIQLTAAIGIGGLIGADGGPATLLETSLVVAHLDHANIMAYDVYGNWAPTTGPLSPLSSRCSAPSYAQSAETAVEVLRKQGFKSTQLLLGIPTYARSYTLLSPKLTEKIINGTSSYYYQNHTSDAPAGGRTDDKLGVDICGNKQGNGGLWLVNELIENGWLSKEQEKGGKNYQRFFDDCSKMVITIFIIGHTSSPKKLRAIDFQPFLTNGETFFSYEDRFSTASKARFSAQNQLGGVFFFDTQGAPDQTIEEAKMALYE